MFIKIATILITISYSCFAGWRIPVRFYPSSMDSIFPVTLYFGVDTCATNGYDPFIDIAVPVPPVSGFFPYFEGDSAAKYLWVDLRAETDTGRPVSHLWRLRFRDEPGESVCVVWEADSFPYSIGYPRFFQFVVSDTFPPDSVWDTAASIDDLDSICVPCESSIYFLYRDITHISESNSDGTNLRLTICPNPFNEECTITINSPEPKKLVILALDGRVVDEIRVRGKAKFRPKNIPSGVYLAIIKGEGIVTPFVYIK